MDEKNKIGLLPATLMVAGNMMGSGVFMLPANLAAIGSIAIFGYHCGRRSFSISIFKINANLSGVGRPVCLCQKSVRQLYGLSDKFGLLACQCGG